MRESVTPNTTVKNTLPHKCAVEPLHSYMPDTSYEHLHAMRRNAVRYDAHTYKYQRPLPPLRLLAPVAGTACMHLSHPAASLTYYPYLREPLLLVLGLRIEEPKHLACGRLLRCGGMGFDSMRCDGMRWDEMRWDGMRWDAIG